MPEPIIASVGASAIGRTALPGRDLFSVELTVRERTAAEREVALDYETDWPVHVFEPR